MVAAGHQTWERGDLLALTFDNPAAEAAWIVDRIEHLLRIGEVEEWMGPHGETPRLVDRRDGLGHSRKLAWPKGGPAFDQIGLEKLGWLVDALC